MACGDLPRMLRIIDNLHSEQFHGTCFYVDNRQPSNGGAAFFERKIVEVPSPVSTLPNARFGESISY